MVLGNIVHSLLQLCLKTGDSDIARIESHLQDLLKTKYIVIILFCLYEKCA